MALQIKGKRQHGTLPPAPSADIVIGADGIHSVLKRQIGLKTYPSSEGIMAYTRLHTDQGTADARFSSDDLSAAVTAASIADRPPVTTCNALRGPAIT